MAEGIGYPEWEALPDFGLYMDQLLLFKERCSPGKLTAGMINSYVKAGIIDRPVGKKYTRESLAQLLMVCHLKQVTSLDALRQLLHPAGGEEPRELYAHFLEGLERLERAGSIREPMSALEYALAAARCQSRCMELLGRETDDTPVC